MSLVLSIILIAVTTAVACSIVGVFLVLRRMSMVAEGVSHSILPGLVMALVLGAALRTPVAVLGPALLGLFLVLSVEALNRTRLFAGDAPLGVVFPALFSVGVIIISRRYASVPLSESSVLTGDINYAALSQLQIGAAEIGPRSLYVMLVILLLNLGFVVALFKELKVTTFDPGLAAAVGIRPELVHYPFMAIVSITIVGAFEAVGAVLVIALLTAPAAAAYLLSRRLETMLLLSAGFAAFSAVSGFWIAYALDSATSGMTAAIAGVVFVLALGFAPRRGLLAKARIRKRRVLAFAERLLVMHLIHHADGDRATPACTPEGVMRHINWDPALTGSVIHRAVANGLVREHHGVLLPSDQGRELCREAMLWGEDACECGDDSEADVSDFNE
ncbi:MAG: metal ABC transporter permease [Spirochaetaceae bacterium]|nr:MAG: metal ABC transporter permease [Spirochaetaceae bacterium]